MDHILLEDPELARAFLLESDRQMSKLEMIASENFVSDAVREAQGSVFTHKYAESYPGKRYYGGCEFVDIAENLAIERAKQLFGCSYANVQPHSGSQANMASLFRPRQARRYHPRYEPLARRPPYPRQPCELLRTPLQHRSLWRGQGHLPHRL